MILTFFRKAGSLPSVAFGIVAWLATEQSAVAQDVLLAQSGMAKTAIGWTLVVLCLALGLIVVCRPNRRKPLDKR